MRKIIFHCLLLNIGIVFFFGIYLFILSRDLPSLERLENFNPDLVTRIYSSDEVVLHELFFQKRVFTELRDIPEHMRRQPSHRRTEDSGSIGVFHFEVFSELS